MGWVMDRPTSLHPWIGLLRLPTMDTVGMGNFNQEGWAMMACAVDGRRRKYSLTGSGIWAGLMSKGSEGKGRITITFQVLAWQSNMSAPLLESRRKFTVVMLTVYGGQAGRLGRPRE